MGIPLKVRTDSSPPPETLYTPTYQFANGGPCDISSVPIGSTALILLMTIMPRRLQTEPSASRATSPGWHGFAPGTLKRIDFLGAFLLLGACLLLVTALEQAAAGISFAERKILPLLILSGLMWTAFLIWQWYATTKLSTPEPVLPWRMLTNRVFLGMIL